VIHVNFNKPTYYMTIHSQAMVMHPQAFW
jgi:hypothetical protein